MQEFEKWAGPAFYYGKNPLDRPMLDAKRKAWRAALEWVLTQKVQSTEEVLIDEDAIRKELN